MKSLAMFTRQLASMLRGGLTLVASLKQLATVFPHKGYSRAAGEMALGLTMGLAGGLFGLFQGGYQIGVVVGLAMVAVVVVSNIMGVGLPFILLRLGLDPAVASSPLITSIADATGLLIYFAIAVWFLGG